MQLKRKNMGKVKNFPPYEEASNIVIEKGIKSQAEYKAQCEELGLPSNPNRTYKEDWTGWPSFFGKDKKSFPSSYEEAKMIVIEKGIKSPADYKAKYKELGLPSKPNKIYKEEWIDWTSFLGKEKKSFPSSYEEARRTVIEKGITSFEEYQSKHKELGLPSNPNYTYKDKGWIGWTSFLGKEKKSFPSSYEEAKMKVM